MTGNDAAVRTERKIAPDDPEFSVRLASITDLRMILQEAKEFNLSASWSTEQALLQQVNPDAMAIICPLFSNGGLIDDPPSCRCYIWFVSKPDNERVVSLLDVMNDSLSRLSEASDVVQLRKVVRVLLDGSQLGPLA